MTEMTTNPNSDGQITLKELIAKLQGWYAYLLSNWKWILLAGILGAASGLTYAFFQKYRYNAEVTFVLEESKGSQLGSYAGIASQFGIDLGGTGGSGIFSGENIIEFLRSRLMVERTLLSAARTGGNPSQSFADLFIAATDKKSRWKKNAALLAIHFPANNDRSQLSRMQDSVLGVLYEDILKHHLVVSKPDKKLSFILVRCSSPSELFSKGFIERLVSEATDFYVQTKTKRFKLTVDKLQAKADSIEHLLNAKTYSVAASQDLNLNPARSVARVGTELGTRDKLVLQTMYAEVVKNLEISRMSMAQETPIIQVVDTPILPLKKVRLGKLKALITGGFAGALLVMLLMVIRKFYREIMV